MADDVLDAAPKTGAPRAERLGNYEPLVELATGGMATVYVARQLGAAGFQRLVVIKRVHRHLLKDRAFTDMFRDEATMCSSLRHPNIAPVIDVVEADGELLLILDYVESLPLSALMRAAALAGGPLDAPVASRILSDALAGLHAAHEAVDLEGKKIELVHRDVSPQNLIVGVDGSSRLIDFGIAKARSRASVTTSGVVKGKLRYMSPEQVQQKTLDRRADVFAAGVVLYEAITGRRPFPDGEDEGDVVVGILLGDAPPPSSIIPGLPAALDLVLEKALARRRDERFSTAAEFQDALERAVPPAATRAVASAVEALAGAELGRRRQELSAALAAGVAVVSPGQPPPSASRENAEPATLAAPAPASGLATHKKTLATLVVCAVVIATGALAFAAKNRARASAPAAASVATSSSAAVALDPAPADAPVPAAAAAAPTTSIAATARGSPSTPPPATPAPRKPERGRLSPSELHRRNPYGTP